MPASAPAASDPATDIARPTVAAAIANRVWRCSGSPRTRRATRAVMNGVAPNTISTLATGARPRARMKATMLPAIPIGAREQGAAGIARVDPGLAPPPDQQRQDRDDHQGRSPERHVPCRKIDLAGRAGPPVLKTTAAVMAQMAPTVLELSPLDPRFHDQSTVNTESACPRLSIPWTCRPSSHASRGGEPTSRPCPFSFSRPPRTCHRI